MFAENIPNRSKNIEGKRYLSIVGESRQQYEKKNTCTHHSSQVFRKLIKLTHSIENIQYRRLSKTKPTDSGFKTTIALNPSQDARENYY